MARKGQRSVTNRRRTIDDIDRETMQAGKRAAEEVDDKRRAALRRRAKAIAAAPVEARKRAVPVSPARRQALGPKGIATLVAEGDSWFDYFGYDVLNQLEQRGYDIEHDARAGDRVEGMAYGRGQLPRFRKLLEKMLRREEVPKAILLSGGGNDIAGEEFAMLLDHAQSAAPGLNEDVVRGVIDVRLRNAYLYFLAAVTETCQIVIGRLVPILVHGYAHAVPDGRGVLGGAWILPGPWLEPGFHQKGFPDRATNTALVARLIDRFNDMLVGIVSAPGLQHVHYVDVRPALTSSKGYKTWWGNELHPTERGFKAVADLFAAKLQSL